MTDIIKTTAVEKTEKTEEPKGPGLFSRAKTKTAAAGRKVKNVAGEGVGEVGEFISERRANSRKALLKRQVELLEEIAED